MILHVYLICSDDGTLLTHLLHYYCTADKIIICATKVMEICYPNVTVRTFEKSAQVRNTIWKESIGQADYVIVHDTNELVVSLNDIKTHLEALKERRITHVQCVCYDIPYTQYICLESADYLKTGTLNQSYNEIILFDPNFMGAYQCQQFIDNEVILLRCRKQFQVDLCNSITGLLWGGLGNQLFVVSCTLALSIKYGYRCFFQKKVLFDKHGHYWDTIMKKLPYDDTVDISNYVLLKENVSQDYQSIELPPRDLGFHPNQGVLLNGYYQSELYFKDIGGVIIDLLQYTDAEVTDTVTHLRATYPHEILVGVHVRRGDYCQLQWDLPMQYYHDAKRIVSMHPRFREKSIVYVIFSNDIPWCSKQSEFSNNHFIQLKDYQEMAIMSQMDAYIMSNSTFSWWGIYLGDPNDNKLVVTPYPWFKKTPYNDKIYRTNWIKLNVQ
jgi:hypothetical protein